MMTEQLHAGIGTAFFKPQARSFDYSPRCREVGLYIGVLQSSMRLYHQSWWAYVRHMNAILHRSLVVDIDWLLGVLNNGLM